MSPLVRNRRSFTCSLEVLFGDNLLASLFLGSGERRIGDLIEGEQRSLSSSDDEDTNKNKIDIN